jgi:hypothetical protein
MPSFFAATMTSLRTQPVVGSQVSVVSGFPSSQSSGVPARHACPRHVSSPLQTFPSLHDDPSGSGLPAVHRPTWHVSAPLHGLPSLHEPPSGTPVWRQPVTASHVSVVHGSPSLQLSAVPAAQTPFWHVSAPLQTFPSLHEVPAATAW